MLIEYRGLLFEEQDIRELSGLCELALDPLAFNRTDPPRREPPNKEVMDDAALQT